MEKVKFVDVENDKLNPKSGFYVQFNPEKLQMREAVAKLSQNQFLNEKENQPLIQTSEKHTLALSMHLYFNTLTSFEQTKTEDVRKAIFQFHRYTQPSKNKVRKVGVVYGAISIIGFITSFSVIYTSFNTEGKAVRAEADITIEGQHVGSLASKSLEDQTTMQTIGSTFAQSLKSYGSAVDWKTIAKKQQIKDPLYK